MTTPDLIKETGRAATERFNAPTRRDEYFEVLHEDDVVPYGYTPEPLTPKAAVKGLYAALFATFPAAASSAGRCPISSR